MAVQIPWGDAGDLLRALAGKVEQERFIIQVMAITGRTEQRATKVAERLYALYRRSPYDDISSLRQLYLHRHMQQWGSVVARDSVQQRKARMAVYWR